MITLMVPLILAAIWGLPVMAALFPPLAAHEPWLRLLLLLVAPVSFGALYLLVSGTISLPFQRAVIAGKFPRSLSHPVYGPRRVYGLCWTSIYYFTPLYHALLTVPFLRKAMLRLFGYRGSLDFVVYPDTWLRDLPLLRVGDGAYLANKSTIGTNICLKTGEILVDGITVEPGGIVGHLAMLAPGAKIGEGTEIGVGAALGIRVQVHRNSKIGPGCGINHGAVIGADTEIGPLSYIGVRAVIREGLRLPGGSNIPSGAVLSSQEDVARYISSETDLLNSLRERLAQFYQQHAAAGASDNPEPTSRTGKPGPERSDVT